MAPFFYWVLQQVEKNGQVFLLRIRKKNGPVGGPWWRRLFYPRARHARRAAATRESPEPPRPARPPPVSIAGLHVRPLLWARGFTAAREKRATGARVLFADVTALDHVLVVVRNADMDTWRAVW